MITEQSQQSKKQAERLCLNHAQRRALRQHIAASARRQVATALRRHGLQGEYGKLQCPRCGLHFLGSSAYRCQCQVQSQRRCTLCNDAFLMASQQEWRCVNVCPTCAALLIQQCENEGASASAAYDAYYERRAWDDEQHRLAMEV